MPTIPLQHYLGQLNLPQPDSHKGQNGKALLVGGSDLFHAAIRWSFLAASRITDMTFYSSVAENNAIMHDAKMYGHNGVIVPRSELVSYLEEVDSVLIGPGMRRDIPTRFSQDQLQNIKPTDLSTHDWESDSLAVTRVLTRAGSDKKWVIDAGALQVIEPVWVPKKAVLTPHASEMLRLAAKVSPKMQQFWSEFLADKPFQQPDNSPLVASSHPQISPPTSLTPSQTEALHTFSHTCNSATFILKGSVDLIWNAQTIVTVSGGNAGMTKGGSGDVLAGSLVGFLASSEPLPSAVVASYLNKLAGHNLYQRSGTFFNSSDLADALPNAWKEMITSQDE